MYVMESLVPVVDFSEVNLEKAAEGCFSNSNLQELTEKIHQAFTTVGFVYLKNHGIPQEKVSLIRRYFFLGSTKVWQHESRRSGEEEADSCAATDTFALPLKKERLIAG